MSIEIKYIDSNLSELWDEYVYNHPNAVLYHLFAWKTVIEKTYGHKTYYLAAFHKNALTGILPLTHLKHFIFGNSLISIPFFDMGGILADNEETEKALLAEAIKLGSSLKADTIEFRQPHAHPCLEATLLNSVSCTSKTHKARMLLELPESSEILMKSFKSKLRSQIKKPIKEGLNAFVGGLEFLDDFYDIFLVNMRDLGSPVHSKKLIKNVIKQFNPDAKIVIVKKQDKTIAASVICGFKDTLANPWASALREFSRLSPNMLLYWTMLEYACDNGFQYFDFGRSTPDEGTFKFKRQWGAQPEPLHWYYITANGQPSKDSTPETTKFSKAVEYWQKLPVPVTGILGPMIRKHIGL